MTTWITISLRVLGAAALLGLGSCGGGGGGAAPTINLTGYWQLYLTPTGGAETGPSAVYLTQSGATVDGAAITGTVSGNSFTITSAVSGLFTVNCQGTLSGTVATGTMTLSGLINGTGTFRLVGFTPTGTLAASGTVQGVPVNMTTTAGIGKRAYSDAGLTMLTQVEIVAAYGSQHLEIDFSPAGLTVGTLAVPGTVTATVVYRDDVNTIELAASSGTVTVTRYNGSGFAGSFALTLPGGGSLTGTFDVSWDIAAYDP